MSRSSEEYDALKSMKESINNLQFKTNHHDDLLGALYLKVEKLEKLENTQTMQCVSGIKGLQCCLKVNHNGLHRFEWPYYG